MTFRRCRRRNLLQAQRDYFGAHTYERLDKPRGQFFHTNWTGHGGEHGLGSLHRLSWDDVVEIGSATVSVAIWLAYPPAGVVRWG